MYTNIFTYFHKNKSLEKSQYHKKDIGEHSNDKMKYLALSLLIFNPYKRN